MVYILLGNGFEEIEAIAPGDILRRGGVPLQYLGVGGGEVSGAHGIRICADAELDGNMTVCKEDVFVIPGGMGGVESLEASEAASGVLLRASEAGAQLAAICAGPRVLAKLGLLAGRRITCYPGCESMMKGALPDTGNSVFLDGVLTGRAPGSAIDFGLALLELLRGKEAAESVRSDLRYDR